MDQADQLSFQTKEWSAIPRVSRIVPFGYMEDPNDSGTLLPVILELEALEKAKEYVKQYSYRQVSDWLTATTGRYISHMGLKKRIDIERSRRKKASTLRKWARRIEEAKAKAEEFETRTLGACKATSEN